MSARKVIRQTELLKLFGVYDLDGNIVSNLQDEVYSMFDVEEPLARRLRGGPQTFQFEPTALAVYELNCRARFEEMFKSLGIKLKDGCGFEEHCLNGAQVAQFARTHKRCLRRLGYKTFFPLTHGGEHLMAPVRPVQRDNPRLRIGATPIHSPFVWDPLSHCRYQLVVPATSVLQDGK